MQETVQQKLAETFRDVFGDEMPEFSSALAASDVAAWDSLTHVRLMLTVERRFGIRLSAAEVARLRNVADLGALIESKLQHSSGSGPPGSPHG